MPQVANTSGAPGSSRVAAVQGRDGSLLRSFAFSTSALLGIGFLAWVLVGAEAREPSWSSFGESVPRSFLFMLLVMLPSILLALFASSGGWRLAWWQITPTVSFPGIDRASRFFWPVNTGANSDPTAPTPYRSAPHLVLSTASFPIQETLVTAVGLTSVARRLQ